MILPGGYIASLILLILSLICLGSWANTLKAAGSKWRFEFYSFDLAAGMLVASLVCALTLGTLGWDGFSFLDDVRLAGKRQELFAFASGMIFNLGNMLLLASLSVSGMAVAFSAGLGFAVVVGTIWSIFEQPAGNTVLRGGGALVVMAAVVVSALAYRTFAKAKLMESIQSGKTKSTKKTVSSKGIILALFGGVFLGSFFPLLQQARESEIGLGPYSLGVIFSLGILVSTFVFNLFFMNLPVVGEPTDVVLFFRAKVKQHLKGMLGGVILYLGFLASFVAARADSTANVSPAIQYACDHGGLLIASLWGLFYWKELSSTDTKVGYYTLLMLVLLLVGLGLLAAAPVLAAK